MRQLDDDPIIDIDQIAEKCKGPIIPTDYEPDVYVPKTPFVNWFNIHDEEHLLAYINYAKTGRWPRFFIPAEVEVNAGYILVVRDKLALAWAELKTSTATRD